MHAVVSCLTTYADGRSLQAPCHPQPRAETTRGVIKMIRYWNKAVGLAYLSPSEAEYRSNNICLQSPPNGQEQEETETISDHPRHLAC